MVEDDVLMYHKEARFRYDQNCGPEFKTWMALARAECKALVKDFNECLPGYLLWAREQELPVFVQAEVQEDVQRHRRIVILRYKRQLDSHLLCCRQVCNL